MGKEKKFKKFSLRELLKTILYAIVVVNFIGFTVMFIEEIPNLIMSEVMMVADEESEILIDEGKNTEEVMEKFSSMQKEKYGEEYPAAGIWVKQLIYMLESGPIVQTYVNSLILGTILGMTIYIVSVQGLKGKQLLIEIFIAWGVLLLIILAINGGYKAIINKVINETGVTDVFYDTYVYDIEGNNLFLPYIGVFGIVYLGNLIKQNILTNKLNKELNNK